ncbi:hypothetical protein [Paucisalibacillus globulus]|uniref:hypothetical protein n=1 Tax=Paucisalibacillus globulus TaxID=351095 RepID=UPI000BB96E23|nr:hypothetical protein [Paucisalibacillus globulus]
MKKYLVIIIPLLLITIPIIWWNTQSSIPSGVHLEKEAGSIVIQVEEDELIAPFHIPVTWVKAHPWEKPPVLEDLVLLGETGEKIANIKGKLILDEPNFPPSNWYHREVHGEIIFELNADKELRKNGFVIYPFPDNDLQELYIPSELQLTYEGEILSLSLDKELRLYPIKQNSDIIKPSWQTNSQFNAVNSRGNNIDFKGFFLNIKGKTGSRIEEILFWLPGMPEDYYESYVQYTFDREAMHEADTTGEFIGESLSLPLEMSTSNILLYFPFTDEMKESIGDHVIYLMPYLKTVDESGNVYFHGGSGSIGAYSPDEDRELHSILIK